MYLTSLEWVECIFFVIFSVLEWKRYPPRNQDYLLVITLRLRQNRCHFPNDIFKCIFMNENKWISIKMSLKFVPKCPINHIPALVHIMDWCQSGDKPLSEPILVILLTHICITQPQWVNYMNDSSSGKSSTWISRIYFKKVRYVTWLLSNSLSCCQVFVMHLKTRPL